jgi:hypothetical protein
MYDKAWIVLMCLPPSYSMHFSRHFRWYLYVAKIFYQCLSVGTLQTGYPWVSLCTRLKRITPRL